MALIVDPDPQPIRDYATELGADLTSDLDAAFGDDIDGIAIAAPAVEHYRLAKRAIEAGKPVFVEKPLALTVNEAIELAALASQRKVALMVGHLLQYHPAFLAAVQAVESGSIGTLHHITSNRMNPGRIRVEENALWSMAPHDFSMVLALAGQEPDRVSTLATSIVNRELPDQYSVQLAFPDGMTAQVNVSWLSPVKEHRLTLLGSEGAIVFEDSAADRESKLKLYEGYIDSSGDVPQFCKTEGVPLNWPDREPLYQEMSAFLSAVAGKDQARTGPEEAIPVLKLLHRAESSRLN